MAYELAVKIKNQKQKQKNQNHCRAWEEYYYYLSSRK